MLRKFFFIAFLVILIGFIGKTYHLDEGQVIILTEQMKVSVHLVMAATILLATFIILYYLLRFIAFIRQSPSSWQKYKQNRLLSKRLSLLESAMINTINDDSELAEYHFKRAAQLDNVHHQIEQLIAIHHLIKTDQLEQAQLEISEFSTEDTNLKPCALYLQAKIYRLNNQLTSAISNIKQIKTYKQSKQLCQLLSQCLLEDRQHQELLQLITMRTALSSAEKQSLGIEAHTLAMQENITTNQIADAIRYYEQIPSSYSKAPSIMTCYFICLNLKQDIKLLSRQIDRFLPQLLDNEYHANLVSLIESLDQKDLLKQIEAICDRVLQKTNHKTLALTCRAIIYSKQAYYEKAIEDYQSILLTTPDTDICISARLAISALEKRK